MLSRAVLSRAVLADPAPACYHHAMGAEGRCRTEASVAAGLFTTTHWSVVLAAGQRGTSQANEALGQLCQTYWRPLYAYVRQQGYQPADSQDLTQEFFARLLARNYIGHADPACGRFRTFLLTSLKHFLVSDWRRAQRQKRGGGRVIPWDMEWAESGAGINTSGELTPEDAYDRRWALTLMERVLGLLREEYTAGGKGELFEQLKGCVWGEQAGPSYAAIGASLRLSEGTIKVCVHRLRRRCRELLRAEISHTVSRPEEVEDELRHLLAVVGRSMA